MDLSEFGLTERDIVEDKALLDHPAMLPHDKVKLPKPVDKMGFEEFWQFAAEHLRWFIETYFFFNAGEVNSPDLRPLHFTPHQIRLHEALVKGWYINKEQTIVVVGKHRRAYVTTYSTAAITALSLCYRVNALITANSWDVTRFIKNDMVRVYIDNLPPSGEPDKQHPFNIPIISPDADDLIQFARVKEDKSTGEITTQKRGGQYILFKPASSREGGVSRQLPLQLYSEAGLSGQGVNWDLISKRSANALPKQGPALVIYEGTGETGSSFINKMVKIAEDPTTSYVLKFLKWYDDPLCWLMDPERRMKIFPVGTSAKEKERDALEIERIAKAYREDHNYKDLKKHEAARHERLLYAALRWRQYVKMPAVKYSTLEFNVDFPTTLEDMRPSVRNTVFDAYVIEDLKEAAIARLKKAEESEDPLENRFPCVYPIEGENDKVIQTLRLLRHPGVGARRVIVVDASSGLPGRDPSAAMVARFENYGKKGNSKVTIEAVHDGVVSSDALAQIALSMADIYRGPQGELPVIAIEDEKYGRSVTSALMSMRTQDGEKPRLYRMRGALRGSQVEKTPGFKMNPHSRRFGISYLRTWMRDFEMDYLPIFDQLGSFAENPETGFVRGMNLHDDLVLCLVMIAYIGVEWGYYNLPKPVLIPEDVDENNVKIITRAEPQKSEEVDLDELLRKHFPQLGPNIRREMNASRIEFPEISNEKKSEPTFGEIVARNSEIEEADRLADIDVNYDDGDLFTQLSKAFR